MRDFSPVDTADEISIKPAPPSALRPALCVRLCPALSFVVEHEHLPAVFQPSPCEVPMPCRYKPAQLAAAVIIGIGAAVIILILFRGVLP
jgi:hypothetical protein